MSQSPEVSLKHNILVFFSLVDNVGIKWTELINVLNKEFDWDNLIINTPNMPNISLTKVRLFSVSIVVERFSIAYRK